MTRDEWLAARRTGIGGSDIAAILGISPWRTPLDVWRSKVEPQPEPADLPEPMYWGQILEDLVAREYMRREGRRVQRVNTLLRHPAHMWAIATIDRAVVRDRTRARTDRQGRLVGAEGILECKTAHALKGDEWGRPDDPDAIPAPYAAQGMWYLAVTGLPWCDFAVLIGGQRFLVRRLERDEETIRSMLEFAGDWWKRHVEERTPPPPKTAEEVQSLFPVDNGSALEANEHLIQLYNDARAARARMDEAQTEYEGAVEKLKLALGEKSALTLNGRPIVTWKAPKPYPKTDWKALVEHHWAKNVPGELLEMFTVTYQPPRRFLLKEIE